MTSLSDAARLMSLFRGNSDYHGTHAEPEFEEDKNKWSIKSTAKTIRDPVSLKHWELHLKGDRPLGIVPIMADATCVWGSIDIDDYDVEALKVVVAVKSHKYPLVVCRSKSGGL